MKDIEEKNSFCEESKVGKIKITSLRHAGIIIDYNDIEESINNLGKYKYLEKENKNNKNNKLRIIIDPFNIDNKIDYKTDILLITHNHFDHLDIKSILNVIEEKTIIISAKECETKLKEIKNNINFKKMVFIEPGEEISFNNFFEEKKIIIKGIPAYNINKFRDKNKGILYHPKEDKKLGFLITIENINEKNNSKITLYHTGDSDFIPEMKTINTDIMFIPISGTYVMDLEEASEALRAIKPKIAIPIHYGVIVGSKELGFIFKKKNLEFNIKVLY